MYGARVIKSLSGQDRVHMEFNAAGTFAANDFVMLDGSTGEVVVATAGSSILGVAKEAATASSTGVLVDITPNMVVLMDNDNVGETFAATHVGEWGDFTGGTGAMLVDSNSLSTTVAQLQCLAYNPKGYGFDADTSIGLFYVAERQICESHAAA
jgi:hypothetical protein